MQNGNGPKIRGLNFFHQESPNLKEQHGLNPYLKKGDILHFCHKIHDLCLENAASIQLKGTSDIIKTDVEDKKLDELRFFVPFRMFIGYTYKEFRKIQGVI